MSPSHSQMPSVRTWIIAFGLFGLVLLGGGYLYYRNATARIRQIKHEEIAAIGELKARQIWQWRKDRLDDGNRTMQNMLLRRVVSDIMKDPGGQPNRDELVDRLRLDLMTYKYSDVMLLDLDGRLLLSANAEANLPDSVTQVIIGEAIRRREAMLSDLHLHPSNGRVQIDVVAPVLDDAGNPMAVFVKSSDAESYLYPLIQYWPTPSKSGETLLVRREGDEIIFLNDLRFHSDAAFKLTIPIERAEVAGVQAVLGRRGVFEGIDYRGKPVLTSLLTVPDSNWVMVAKVDLDEIMADSGRQTKVILLVVGLALLLSGAMVASSYRSRQAGLFQSLYLAESLRAAAMEQFRTTLYSIGDGVITADPESRVMRMNRVAEQLTGWVEEDARNRPLDEVFALIKEDTRLRMESPARKAIEEGRAVALTDHVLLVGRDGTEVPIADSFAPIIDEGGKTAGVVVVFRDQTSERAAQAALEASEGLYHSLFENMLDGYAYHRMIYDGDRPVDYEFLKINSAFSTLTGLKDVEGRMASEVIPGIRESDPELLKIYGRVARTGKPERFESHVESLHSWFNISVYSPAPDHFVVVFDNIDERKRAEETLHVYQVELETQNNELRETQSDLQASRSRYFELYDLAPVGYLSLNDQGFILEANLTTAVMMGRGKNDLVNRPLSQFVFPPDQDIHYLHFKELLRSGSPQAYEVRLLKSDGSDLWALVEATAGKDPAGGFLCRAAISDISLRRRAEDSLKKSEQLYSSLFINLMDSMIVHRVIYEDGKPVDYEVISSNPAFTTLSGLTEITGKKVWELIPGVREADPQLYEIFGRVALSGFPERVELFVSALQKWFRYSVFRPSEGHLVVIFHDVTIEKQAQEALRKSEEKYRLIAESTADVIAIHDLELNATYISPSEERLRGYTPAESMSQTIEQLLTPDSLRLVREVLAGELREEMSGTIDLHRTKTLELEEYHKSGGTIWVEAVVSFLRDEGGKPVGILSVARDITRRRAAEEAESRKEERYHRISDAADVITIRDMNLNIIYSSPSVERLRGYTAEETMEQTIEQILSPESLQLARKKLAEQMALEASGTADPARTFTIELEQYHKNGSTIHVEVTVSFLRDREGKPAGLLSVTRDITACRRAGSLPCPEVMEKPPSLPADFVSG